MDLELKSSDVAILDLKKYLTHFNIFANDAVSTNTMFNTSKPSDLPK